MAYNRAPRFANTADSQTGPDVSPNTYQNTYDDKCSCKGTNWAPFLTCAGRKAAQLATTPGPDTYYPKISRNIIGGSSLRSTAPRFPDTQPPEPEPTENDTFEIFEKESEESIPRLKGFMYHCNVPYTMLGYPPTVPKPGHMGYQILQDRTMVECCNPDVDTTVGPAAYHVNYGTFGTCYRGSFWSRYSRRKTYEVSDTPGVGTYDIEPQPSQMEEYLNKLRHERRKNSCSLRYIDQVVSLALRNNYPSPNQYTVGKIKCPKVNKKIVPKRIVRHKKIIIEGKKSPAPNQYTDPRTALEYLVKPSCRKGYSAFLTTAPRFQRQSTDIRLAPNQYKIRGFVEELKNKISPYAIRKTAFDTSVPKKLYYLPPEPIEEEPICPGSTTKPKHPPPPVHPFASKTKRFATIDPGYTATCASYNIQEPFEYLNNHKSFRKAIKYNFLFNEKRFTRLPSVEDKSYIPLFTYDLLKFYPGRKNNSGSFGNAKRFPDSTQLLPGPLDYHVRVHPTRSFNVTLGGSAPLTRLQTQRMKLRRKGRVEQQQQKKMGDKHDSECPEVGPVKVEFESGRKV